MSQNKIIFGKSAEESAVTALQREGYFILERNYRIFLGEVDIIARDGRTVCFVEVKARKSVRQGFPAEAVSPAKQRKLSQLALYYLKNKSLIDEPARFDVVAVLHKNDGSEEITIVRNAFELNSTYSY